MQESRGVGGLVAIKTRGASPGEDGGFACFNELRGEADMVSVDQTLSINAVNAIAGCLSAFSRKTKWGGDHLATFCHM